mmetsp:Transcript_3575/g.11111  ORF Transcript_3575/g.11111 Transcript_3575/m.11111 type:complete len:845 (-) Transcript_3575:233-2767(-)
MSSESPACAAPSASTSSGCARRLPLSANAPSPALVKKLEYGAAPESASSAEQWIAAHDGKFGLFIDGEFHHPAGRIYEDCVNPSNGKVLCQVMNGDAVEDVNKAVAAARAAYPKWSALTGAQRARHLYALARQLQKHQRLLAVVESLDNGKTVRESRDADVPLVCRHFYYHAGWAQLMHTELKDYKPLGVIAQVIPWNFSLLMAAWKIAPALAMGNCIILKPAPSTPLSPLLLAEIAAEAGIPPGVINILPGGNDLGFNLVNHVDVDKVAFTGSTGVGRLLRSSTAGSGKKLSLELGGKSPFMVFEDADLDSAVEGVVNAIWFNQGQVCCAGSRLLVQECVYDAFLAKLKRRMDHLRVGDSLDKCSDIGAINSKRQLETVQRYVEIAREEGATVYQSSVQPLPTGDGFYFPPTLIYDVQPAHTVVVEEIFGPVVTMMSFRSPAEGIKLANNTAYGLASSVWSENVSTCLDMAFKIKAGVVWVNSHNLFDAAAGFGGYKESGFGRESGREGLLEYCKPKWQENVRHSFTEEEKSASWAATIPATPLIPGQASKLPEGVRQAVNRTHKMYIGGSQCRPDAPYVRAILSPSGQLLGEVGEGNRKDVRNAVEAAYAAAPGWGKRAAYNRSQILYFVAENLDAQYDQYVKLIDAMTGCGEEAARHEVTASIDRLFYWAAFTDKYGGNVQETPLYGATVSIHEPVGVVGIACPDECPLLAFVSLFAPAIVRGNAVVIVPSQQYPLAAVELFRVFECSDVPAGVVNVITGDRDHLTKTLAEHMEVTSMWYFGPKPIGSYHVEKLSASNLKRTFCNYGVARDWYSEEQAQGHEFLYHATQVKNVWIPAGSGI